MSIIHRAIDEVTQVLTIIISTIKTGLSITLFLSTCVPLKIERALYKPLNHDNIAGVGDNKIFSFYLKI